MRRTLAILLLLVLILLGCGPQPEPRSTLDWLEVVEIPMENGWECYSFSLGSNWQVVCDVRR
jgi:hypothetical protein